MSKQNERRLSLARCLSAAAALAITVTIVLSLDALADHYAAAPQAKPPIKAVLLAKR